MPLLERRCRVCGREYTLLSLNGVVSNLAREDHDTSPACLCGADDAEALIAPSLESSRKYPYFDRGLGREITSYRHWRQVCSELNVIPTEGESIGTWDDIADKEASAGAESDRAYGAYLQEMEQGEARGEWARLQEHLGQRGVRVAGRR